MKNFALIGVGGFIAPRHLEAIHALGHNLVAAYDPNDSVGIMDRYFPNCAFYTDFERFQSFLESGKVRGQSLDYISICTPNHLHSSHIQFGLRFGADVICEKPLVLYEHELDEIVKVERQTGKKVFTVLQLRVHEAIKKLREDIHSQNRDRFKIDLSYMTSRGAWYHESWKGDAKKSGGLSSNIGVHFFDMLTWIFGKPHEYFLSERSATAERGTMVLDRADVNWYLTIDSKNLPDSAKQAGKTTFRSIKIDGKEFEFSEGFTELHKTVYSDIFAGRGYGIEDARHAIHIVERLRNLEIRNV